MLRNVVASTSYSASTVLSSLRAAAVPLSYAPLRHFTSSPSRAEGEGSYPEGQGPSDEASTSSSSSAAAAARARSTPVSLPGSQLPASSPPPPSSSSSSAYSSPSTYTSPYATYRPTTLYKLHVQTTRNNTLITLTRPNGATLYSVSSGQVGFKGANRSGFEAGYQTALNVFATIQRRRHEWGAKFRNEPMAWLHVVWNGFGQGRDAVYRAFLSAEGESARAMVHTMSDATRIKIGGVRPKKRRNY